MSWPKEARGYGVELGSRRLELKPIGDDRGQLGEATPPVGEPDSGTASQQSRPGPQRRRSPVTMRPVSAKVVACGRSRVGSARQGGRSWSQSGDPTAGSDSVTGPLTSGFGGAPRGIRTPNRQIRSQPSPIPAPPSHPLASPLVLVNGHVAHRSRASVPVRHAWLGRIVVAVSGRRRQTGSLATGRSPGYASPERQIRNLVLYPRAPPHCGLSQATAVSVPGIRQYSRTVTPTDQTEDAAILAAVRAGDQAAFTALAERYRRQLHVHCYRMLGSFEDAEDVVQETLLRAWRSRASFQSRSLFRTWLYRIATNACLNALQRAAPHPGRRRPPTRPGRGAPGRAAAGPAGAARRAALAAALPGPPARPGRPERRRTRRCGRRPRDDRAGVPDRHPIPAAQTASHPDPARRAGLVGQGYRRPAGDQRGLGEQRAPARPLDDAGAAASTTARLGAGDPPDRRRTLRAPALHGRPRPGRRGRLRRAAARRRPPGDATAPALVPRARGHGDPVRALHPSHLAELPGPAAMGAHGRQPAAGGGRLRPAGGRRPLPAPRAQRAGDRGRAAERHHLLRRPAAGGVRPPPDAPADR